MSKFVWVCLVLLFWAAPSSVSWASSTTYWKPKALLADFFPTADKITYKKVTLSSDDLTRLEGQLGYRPERTEWTVFIAIKDGKEIGYAVMEDELGQHEPITFAAKLDQNGTIQRLEVMVYREAHGSEVREERFWNQFVGKSWADDLKLGSDIVGVSGATISCRSIMRGAKRVSAVVALLAENKFEG